MGLAYGVGYQPIMGAMPQAQAADNSPALPNTLVIDGTPVRVVAIALSAAAGLTALKWAGFRFNVGVSN